jgi:tol-pal system protein YbgF
MTFPALFPLGALVLASVLGCARSAEERQLDAMRDEIDNIRDSRDRADNVTNSQGAAGPSLVVPQAYTSAAPARPPSVVQIGSEGSGNDDAEADPQDTTPRPTIRVFGSQHVSVRNGWRGDDRVEQAVTEEGTSGPSSARRGNALDPEAKRAYDAALSLVNAKRFGEALDALAAFLVKWPDHPYANNAMYWRGECYFARGDYPRAAEQFDGVLKRFPAGAKAPDALLKLGMSHQKLGNLTKAKECFDRLAQQHPESEAARRIPTIRLPAAVPPRPAPEEHR